MPTITVRSGPYKGWTGTSLLDLLAHQDDVMANCPHPPEYLKHESGKSGLGLRRKHWKRQCCTKCNAVVAHADSISVPDHPGQRKVDEDFWTWLDENILDEPWGKKVYVIWEKFPDYGWSPQGYVSDSHAYNKGHAIKEILGHYPTPEEKPRFRVTIHLKHRAQTPA